LKLLSEQRRELKDILLARYVIKQGPHTEDLTDCNVIEYDMVLKQDLFVVLLENAVELGPLNLVWFIYFFRLGRQLRDFWFTYWLGLLWFTCRCCNFYVVETPGHKLFGDGLKDFSGKLAYLFGLLLHILVDRLAASMRYQIAFLGLLPLGYDDVAVSVVFNFADAGEHDKWVGWQFLEIRRFPEQKNLEHQFDSHLCKNSIHKFTFGELDQVDIIWGRLQIVTILA